MPNANTYAAKVYQALPGEDNPIPFADLEEKLGHPDHDELYGALQSLALNGEAAITYGRGWHRALRWFTVVGLIDDASGQLMIAGVVEGSILVGGGECPDGYTQWADSFEAESASHAEDQAHDSFNDSKENDDDN